MSDDLVKRLRDLGDHAAFEPHMHHTAADRIEELEAKLAKCQALMHAGLAEYKRRLVMALEALVVIDALDPEGLINGCSQSGLRGLVLRMGETARTVLAELEGELDD
jgi:hypothetical protein